MLHADSSHDNPLNRRTFLQAGSLAVGGLTFSPFAVNPLFASGNAANPLSGKSVIFLFMQGGPSQHETFDPKPDASDGIRTVGGVTPTTIPGISFGAAFTRLAQLAGKLAVIRSFSTGTQHGGLKPIVSELTQGISLGALYSRVAGPVNQRTGLPNAACLFPVSVDPKEAAPRDRFGRFDVTGSLGSAYAPFVPGGAGPFQANLKLRLDPDRLDDRQSLLKEIDRLSSNANREAFGGVEGFRQQATEILLKGAAETLDISREGKATLARYDTSSFLDPKLWGTKKNGPNYTANCKTLGKLLLLARRMAEAGCGFITINTEFVWDMHADGNNVAVSEGMKLVGAPFDHAVSAFIEDVEARGLSEKILLVCCGEMGRTPKLNKNGGRDHWPKLAPLLLYGGGLTRGQVVGSSTKDGGEAANTPLEPRNLLATISRTLFDLGTVRVTPGLPKEVLQPLANVENTRGVV